VAVSDRILGSCWFGRRARFGGLALWANLVGTFYLSLQRLDCRRFPKPQERRLEGALPAHHLGARCRLPVAPG